MLNIFEFTTQGAVFGELEIQKMSTSIYLLNELCEEWIYA